MKILFILVSLVLQINLIASDNMQSIRGGKFVPLYLDKKNIVKEIVKPFELDVYPVTNKDFSEFILSEPKWSPEKIRRIFAEENYLKQWKEDPSAKENLSPVTNISWFAARAYCTWKGKRLPSSSEWEFVAQASETKYDASKDKSFVDKIMQWYSKPNSSKLPEIGAGYKNKYGIYDMHGQVWEWVEDFSTAMVTGDSRNDSSLDKGLFCGSGAIGANDFGNYATFLRYGLRSSLKANYTLPNVGFRCAR